MNLESDGKQAEVRYTVMILDSTYDTLVEFSFATLEEAVEFVKLCFANGYHKVGIEQE
jgi:hypothetical protein